MRIYSLELAAFHGRKAFSNPVLQGMDGSFSVAYKEQPFLAGDRNQFL
jgi:hypothetical protein